MDEPWQVLDQLSSQALIGGIAIVAGLLLILLAVLLFRRRAVTVEPPAPDLHIDLATLPAHGPDPEGPWLEVYGLPVRLAVLVLAPAGRNSPTPDEAELPELFDSLVPGLGEIIQAHSPLVRCWPFQLSTQGFAHAFFNNVQLPGERGKGTPWCAVAGRFDQGERQFLAGLVCVADRPNSLSQVTVAHVGQWLDVLRIRY